MSQRAVAGEMDASATVQINNNSDLDNIVAQSKSRPTVILVFNSAMPVCRKLIQQYAQVATEYESSDVCFSQMDLTSETSMLFKFAPNQLPVCVFTHQDSWGRIIMAANEREIQAGVKEMLARVRS